MLPTLCFTLNLTLNMIIFLKVFQLSFLMCVSVKRFISHWCSDVKKKKVLGYFSETKCIPVFFHVDLNTVFDVRKNLIDPFAAS